MGEHIINAFSILSLFGKPTNELLALLFWQNIVSQYHKQIILDATGQKFYIKGHRSMILWKFTTQGSITLMAYT